MKRLIKHKKILVQAIAALVIVTALLLLIYYFADKMTPNFASITGGVLSAIATAFLGLIALWQNTRYKKLADEANDKYIRPEFFLISYERYTNEYYNLPTLKVIPTKTERNGKVCQDEIVCCCKVLEYPVISIRPKCLVYSIEGQITDYYHDFEEQSDLALVLEKSGVFRIIILKYIVLCDFELEVEYENIYGDTYSKLIQFRAPSKNQLSEASIFGTFDSGEIVMRPARRVVTKN